MKKGSWKKVLIIVVALMLCFTVAACTPEKKKEAKVPVKEFLDELIKGLDGMIKPLGDKSQPVRHVDVTLVADIKDGTTPVADLKIRIAGNFTGTEADIGKNEVRLEVFNKGILLIGIYEKDNKIYLQESISTSDGKMQKLSIEGVQAFKLQQYLAKLPDILSNIGISDLDLEKDIGAVIGSISGSLESLFSITKGASPTGGTKYIAKLIFDDGQKGGLMSIMNTLLNGLVADYGSILNTILPGVLGMNFTNGMFVPIEEGHFPEIAIQVFLAKDTNAFEGLTFDYKFPKKGAAGNTYNVEVGLQDINISTTGSTVNDDIVATEYKPGAIKVSADIAIPGLMGTGVNLTADFFLQPGFSGEFGNTAAQENEFLKVQLVGKIGANNIPLVAEYKYLDVAVGDTIEIPNPDGSITTGTATYAHRIGRLYFDIAALYEATGVTPPTEGTKYFKDIDLNSMLFGVMDLNSKTFAVDLTGLEDAEKALVDTVDITYTGAKNYQYYNQFPVIYGATDFWAAWNTSISIKKGETTIGNVEKVEYTKDARIDYVSFGTDAVYKITLPYETWLAALKLGATAQPTVKLAITKAEGETSKPTTTVVKDEIFVKPEGKNYYYFPVYNPGVSDTAIENVYIANDGDETAIKGTVLNTLLTADIITKVLADPNIAPKKPGLVAKVYLGKSIGRNQKMPVAISDEDMAKTIGELIAGTDNVAKHLYFIEKDDTNYYGRLYIVYEEVDATQEAYNTLFDANKAELEKFVQNNLSRYEQNGSDLPKMTSDIEVYGNPSSLFEINIDELSKVIGMVLNDKLSEAKAGKITLGLTDAAGILGMAKYLATPDLFAAQIRMLLSGEKSSEAYQQNAVNAPFKPYVIETEAKLATDAAWGGIATKVKANTNYLQSKATGALWAAMLGRLNAEELAALKAEGWTDAQVAAYNAATDQKAKAEVFAKNEKDSYAARVKIHSDNYDTQRQASEKKAMDTIRSYIGRKGTDLANVATVKEFLYEGGGLKIEVSWDTEGTGIIAGMPLSIKIKITRGTLLIAEAKAGIQFIEASTIPGSGLADNYWDGAINIHKTVEVSGEGYETQMYSSLVVELAKLHVAMAGEASGFTLQSLLLKPAKTVA